MVRDFNQSIENLPKDPFKYDFESMSPDSRSYASFDKTMHGPSGIDLVKDNKLREFADAAKMNLRKRTDELKRTLLSGEDEGQYDDFLIIAEARIDELVHIIWQEISNNKDRELNYNGVYGSAKAGLFSLAVVKDLSSILDTNNNLSLAGMMEGGDFDMDTPESLELAVDQIMKEAVGGYHPENYRERIEYNS